MPERIVALEYAVDGLYVAAFLDCIDGLATDSKYVFQYVRDVELHNARITTKDAFWEVENVTVYDSELPVGYGMFDIHVMCVCCNKDTTKKWNTEE